MKNLQKAFIAACIFELAMIALFLIKNRDLGQPGLGRIVIWYHMIPMTVIAFFSFGSIHSGSLGRIISICAVVAAQVALVTIILLLVLTFVGKLKPKFKP